MTFNRTCTFLATVTLWALPLSSTLAATPNARNLMKKATDTHRIPIEWISATMTLQNKRGEQLQRSYEQLSAQNDKTGDRTRIRFTGPADIRGTALLAVEDTKTKENNQWLYLPAFRKTRRIGTSELGDRFVNSDIYFEDMKRRYVEDYKYKIKGGESVDGHSCWVIEGKPTDPKVKKESPYGKTETWLRKDNLVAVKTRFYDRRLRPLKELRLSELKQVGKDAWRANRMEVTDMKRKHRTVLITHERKTSVDIDANAFSQHQLGAP